MRTSTFRKVITLSVFFCLVSLAFTAPVDIDLDFLDEKWFVRLVDEANMKGFFSIEETKKIVNDYRARYPNLFLPDEVFGETFEKRPIVMHCMTNKQSAKATFKSETKTKKIGLITAMTHGREPLGLTQLLYTWHKILTGYTQGHQEMVDLVDNNVLCFIPIVNIDAYYLTLEDYKKTGIIRGIRRNRNNSTLCGTSGIDHFYGTDLNRNFDFCWNANNKGSSTSACDYNFRGLSPFSEPETQAFKKFVEENEDKIKVVVSLHTYGDLWVLPFTCDAEYTIHNTTRIRSIYKDFKDNAPIEDKSSIGNTMETLNYSTAGDSGDWLLGKHGIINMTPEIGPKGPKGRAFFPDKEVIMPSVRKAHPGIFYMVSKLNPSFEEETVQIESLNDQRNHTAVSLNLLYKSYRDVEVEISVNLHIVDIQEKSLEENPTPTIYFVEKSLDDTIPRTLAFIEAESYGVVPSQDGKSVLYSATQKLTVNSWTYFEAIVLMPYAKYKTSTLEISINENDLEIYSFVKDIEGNFTKDAGNDGYIGSNSSIVLPILLTISFFVILALVFISRCYL